MLFILTNASYIFKLLLYLFLLNFGLIFCFWEALATVSCCHNVAISLVLFSPPALLQCCHLVLRNGISFGSLHVSIFIYIFFHFVVLSKLDYKLWQYVYILFLCLQCISWFSCTSTCEFSSGWYVELFWMQTTKGDKKIILSLFILSNFIILQKKKFRKDWYFCLKRI